MSKHTPGPWGWDDHFRLVGRHGMNPYVLDCGSFGTRKLLRVRDDKRDVMVPLTPNHPDARLIAAAPDLLEALRKIEREAAAIAATCPPAPHACPACEILFVAREAIAKAEGGAA